MRTIEQSDLFAILQDQIFKGIRVAETGTIQEYDALTQLCSVLPAVKRKDPEAYVGTGIFEQQEYRAATILNQVPVVWPSAGGGILHFPLTAGSEGLIVYGDYPISNWLEVGGQYEPETDERHGLNGSFFIPGGLSVGTEGLSGDSVQLKFGDAEIELTSDGKAIVKGVSIELQKGATEPLVLGNQIKTLLSDLLNLLGGPIPSCAGLGVAVNPVFQAQIELVKPKLELMLSESVTTK